MKKLFFAAAFCFTAYLVNAQSVHIGWYDNLDESQNTGIYFQEGVSTLFPDSTVKVGYGNGSGGIILGYNSLEGVGEVFDASSGMYVNPVTSNNPPHTIDSVGLVYAYHYVQETGAAPDTLIFQFYSQSAIDTATFHVNGFSEPYGSVGYDYHKNLGVGAAGVLKYILGPKDDTHENINLLRIPTNGIEGQLKTKALFAYTVSYRPGFKYDFGDTIEENWTPAPKKLHSHFRVGEGFVSKFQTTDYEGSLSIVNENRYNNFPTWNGRYIAGSTWPPFNQILWAPFHLQRYVNIDAGLNGFTAPLASSAGVNYCGDTTLPVMVQLTNYLGNSDLTSATISWTINGKVQSDYKWTGKITQSNSAVVTLGSYHFQAGTNNIRVVVNSPNGAVDSLTFNDTANLSLVINPVPDTHFTGSQISSELIQFTPKDASLATYNWNFGDGSPTSAVESPSHQYAVAGSYTVKMSGTKSGCSSTFDTTINATFSSIAPIETKNFGLNLYPNPFSDNFTVNYEIKRGSHVKIDLYNAAGQVIGAIIDEVQPAGKYQYELNSEKYQLDAGVYLLKLSTDEGYVSKQIVKY